MKNEEKAQEIVNKNFEWISNFVEENNLSKEDRNNIRYKMYSACQEIAEWKDCQPQIIEIFGKRVKIVNDTKVFGNCSMCAFSSKCQHIDVGSLCEDSSFNTNRHFVEVDEDGSEIKQ